MQVLEELDMGSLPVITAWNKSDACPDPEQVTMLAQTLIFSDLGLHGSTQGLHF
jgi:50S ribosomal subunit-associated GTPase HflX